MSGVVLGMAGRLAMRVVALTAGLPPGASLGGTLEVIATGVLIGSPAALIFMALRRFTGRLGILVGPIFGLLVLSVLLLFPPPAAQSAARTVGALRIPLAAFGVAFVCYGTVLELCVRRWLGPAPRHRADGTGS